MSSHPAFLIVIVVGLVARRWLPDPILFFKHQARVRSLQADIDANASNATARRDLAKIWLEKHRPRRALPLLEQAIARDSRSIELLYLSGVAHLLAGNHDKAVEALVAVTHREPNFQYGEAYLRAADALMALGRWDDAADALERYVKINSSSVEARWKRLRVCKARKDAAGEQTAKADLRDVWRTLPGYQRRKQLELVPAVLVLVAQRSCRTSRPVAPPPARVPCIAFSRSAFFGLCRSVSSVSSAYSLWK